MSPIEDHWADSQSITPTPPPPRKGRARELRGRREFAKMFYMWIVDQRNHTSCRVIYYSLDNLMEERIKCATISGVLEFDFISRK